MRLGLSSKGLALFGGVVFMALRGGLALAHEEQVIVVGHTAAGALVVDSDFEQPVELPASIFPGIDGFAIGELAFHSLIADDPTNDFFQVSPAADFRFVLLAKDAGVEVWNDTGSGFMRTNESFFVGPAPFDAHPIWNIVATAPATELALTLLVRDVNGVYADSAPFALRFVAARPPPRLAIEPLGSQHFALRWATNLTGWELQGAGSVGATNWSAVTNLPVVLGTNYSLTINAGEPQQFFRLHLP